ncbi:hypothetical protein LTR36_008550 [Oleoguttula mirabilis]|uniref:Uncharacterized protein n=1 Tax=Oleoguttula mirabilis TaxID=1507867 RepID=A0AAV9JUK0_9PEZI|nr:hypothetical protein LTR36_008550 [Oleoguttula mirabilis]
MNFLDEPPLLRSATVSFGDMVSFGRATRELLNYFATRPATEMKRLEAVRVGVIFVIGYKAHITLEIPGLATAWKFAAANIPVDDDLVPDWMFEPGPIAERLRSEALREANYEVVQMTLEVSLQSNVESYSEVPTHLWRFFAMDNRDGVLKLQLKGRLDSRTRLADFTISLTELCGNASVTKYYIWHTPARWDFNEGIDV